MKNLKVVSLTVAMVAGTFAPSLRAQEGVQEIMQAKLGHAQKVLEALALEDHRAVAKHAQELSLLSQAAAWQVLQTAQYRQHSADFRRAADSLVDAAKKENVAAAALGYVQLTLNCVNCHKYVRRVRAARLDPRLSEQRLSEQRLSEQRLSVHITLGRDGED